MKLKFLLLTILQITALTSTYAMDVETAAKSRKWHVLLHYRQTVFGYAQSEVDPSPFFLSATGYKSPLDELRATIEAFQRDPGLACRYPARRRFLLEELRLKNPNVTCEKYENWRSVFVPESLSLVFASAYFGNAASAFGHTFLRIDGALTTPDGPRNALLDYGLNFAAQVPPTDGALAFAYKGITGGYRGVFSILPYVEKLQEYRDREERDLWEYRLDLKPDQVERLLEHLWELETSHIPYYFLNKNCSYNLLALLEVANPDWKLTGSFKYMALPTDTIRVLIETPNAVKQISYRPSLHRLLQSRMKAMNAQEKAEFLRLRKTTEEAVQSESTLVLDSLLDEQKFRYGLDSEKYPAFEQQRLKSILQARARSTGKTHRMEARDIEELRVDRASGSRKLSLAAGQTADRTFREIAFRAAYHDALDADQGALSFSEISVLDLRLRQLPDQDHSLHLEKLDLLRIVSLTPMNALQKRLSWMVDVGIGTAPDEMANRFDSGKTRYLQGGGGVSAYLYREKLLAYSFLKLNIEHSDNRDENFRYAPSAQIGLWLRILDQVKAGASTDYFSYRPFDDFELESHFNVTELQLSWIFHQDWNLRAEQRLVHKPNESEHRISLSRYF